MKKHDTLVEKWKPKYTQRKMKKTNAQFQLHGITAARAVDVMIFNWTVISN
jgi:hypothetical protein